MAVREVFRAGDEVEVRMHTGEWRSAKVREASPTGVLVWVEFPDEEPGRFSGFGRSRIRRAAGG